MKRKYRDTEGALCTYREMLKSKKRAIEMGRVTFMLVHSKAEREELVNYMKKCDIKFETSVLPHGTIKVGLV